MQILAVIATMPALSAKDTNQTDYVIPSIKFDDVPLADAIRNLPGSWT